MKKKRFHTADNTILDCPKVDYKYNRDTYVKEKNLFWLVSIIGFLTSTAFVIFSKNSVVQTIAGAFMGGILSLIVWLFTIRHQDKMNYELAIVEMHIMRIDDLLEYQHAKTEFIDPEEEELVQADSESVILRFMHLWQLILSLCGDEYIDTSSIELKFLKNEKVLLNDFNEKSEEIMMQHLFYQVATEEEWSKMIAWNNWYLDWQLNDLKKKLLRYKTYILCGNAPENYRDYKTK